MEWLCALNLLCWQKLLIYQSLCTWMVRENPIWIRIKGMWVMFPRGRQCRGSKSNIPCCALIARQVRATFAWLRATWRRSYANFARSICVTYAPDSRRIHAGCASHLHVVQHAPPALYIKWICRGGCAMGRSFRSVMAHTICSCGADPDIFPSNP
jgi:hypothetical protein